MISITICLSDNADSFTTQWNNIIQWLEENAGKVTRRHSDLAAYGRGWQLYHHVNFDRNHNLRIKFDDPAIATLALLALTQ